MFAGTMLVLAGIFSIIDGIAAVSNSSIYVSGAQFIFSNLNAWGWAFILIGAFELLIGFGIFARNSLATFMGIVIAGLSVLVELAASARYPLWTLVMVALDVLIIYGLCAYGFQQEQE